MNGKEEGALDFGELRALLHNGQNPDALELVRLLEHSFTQDPQQYIQKWLPYLQGFELPRFQAFSREALLDFETLLPENAPRSLHLQSCMGGEEDFKALASWPALNVLSGWHLRRAPRPCSGVCFAHRSTSSILNV